LLLPTEIFFPTASNRNSCFRTVFIFFSFLKKLFSPHKRVYFPTKKEKTLLCENSQPLVFSELEKKKTLFFIDLQDKKKLNNIDIFV